jgi:hypothetical protein
MVKKWKISLFSVFFWLVSFCFYGVYATGGGGGPAGGSGTGGMGGASGLTSFLGNKDNSWIYMFTFGLLLALILILLIMIDRQNKKDQAAAANQAPPKPPAPYVPPVPTMPYQAGSGNEIVGNRNPSTFNGQPYGFVEEVTPLPGTNNTITGSRSSGGTCITVNESNTRINGKLVPPGTYYLKKGDVIQSGPNNITM